MPKRFEPAILEVARALYRELGRGSGPDTELIAKALEAAHANGVVAATHAVVEQDRAAREMADPRKRFTAPAGK